MTRHQYYCIVLIQSFVSRRQIKNSLIIDYNLYGNPMDLRGLAEPPTYDRLQGNPSTMQKFMERVLVEQTGKALPSVEEVDARTLNPRGVIN